MGFWTPAVPGLGDIQGNTSLANCWQLPEVCSARWEWHRKAAGTLSEDTVMLYAWLTAA